MGASPATQALYDAGVTIKDVAALIGCQPAAVGRWLRGTRRPSPELAGALEELVDAELAARVTSLIPQGGCPACHDSSCEVPRGQCHLPRCTQPVRLDFGQPGIYCTLRCSVAAQARPRTGGIVEWAGKDGRTYRSVRVMVDGVRRLVRLGPVSREAAERERRQILADVERGTWQPQGDRRGEAITAQWAGKRADIRDSGRLLGKDIAKQLGVVSVAPYVRDGRMVAERWRELLVVEPAELARFKRFKREQVRSAVNGHGDRRHAQWFDPEYVLTNLRARGSLARYAERHGVSMRVAEIVLLDGLKARRTLVLSGRPTKDELGDQLRAIAAELIDQHHELGDLAQLSETSFLAEIGLLAWQRDLSDFRKLYPAGRGVRDDADAPARGWRKSIVARVRRLIGQDAKALLIPTTKP
jgi:hypothetical protein